eukprot:3809100-Amphidinium_carterae.1
MLAPACGLEVATDLRPGHVAVGLPLKLERLSRGLRVEAGYQAARANTAGAWILAVQEINLDMPWQLWCCFSESALGLPVGSGGRLVFVQRSPAAPEPVEEVKQHPMVVILKDRFWLPDLALVWSGQTFWDHLLEGGQHSLDAWYQRTVDAWYQRTVKAEGKKRRS